MKLQFLQSGGFAGLVKGSDFDTQALAPEQAKEIEHLVRECGIAASGEFLSNTARDLHQYEISIEDGDRKVSVTFDDANIPQNARALLGFLKKHARPKALD